MLKLELELAPSHNIRISFLRPRVNSLGPIIDTVLGLELELSPSDLPHIKLVSLDLGLPTLHRTMISSLK